jgi:hypothetical protein
MTDFTYEEIVAIMEGESEDDIDDISPAAFKAYFNDDRIEESVEAADMARDILDELNPHSLFELLKEAKIDPQTFFIGWDGTWNYGETKLMTYALFLESDDPEDVKLRHRITSNECYWTSGGNGGFDAHDIAQKLSYILNEIRSFYLEDSVSLKFIVNCLLNPKESEIAELVHGDDDYDSVALVKYYLVLVHMLFFEASDVVKFIREHAEFIIAHDAKVKEDRMVKIIEQRWRKLPISPMGVEWLNYKNWPKLLT